MLLQSRKNKLQPGYNDEKKKVVTSSTPEAAHPQSGFTALYGSLCIFFSCLLLHQPRTTLYSRLALLQKLAQQIHEHQRSAMAKEKPLLTLVTDVAHVDHSGGKKG